MKSYTNQFPIRVFRSSKNGKYAPPARKGKTKYRYDGLYIITGYYKIKNVSEEYFAFMFRRKDKLDLKIFNLENLEERNPLDWCIYAATVLTLLRHKDFLSKMMQH